MHRSPNPPARSLSSCDPDRPDPTDDAAARGWFESSLDLLAGLQVTECHAGASEGTFQIFADTGAVAVPGLPYRRCRRGSSPLVPS